MTRRTERLNSLLREVLSEVIRHEVRNPDLAELVTVTRTDITTDLMHAKVYVSIIGDDEERDKCLKALTSAAGFIAVTASKRVRMHHFPTLTFHLDTTAEKQAQIDALVNKVQAERHARGEE